MGNCPSCGTDKRDANGHIIEYGGSMYIDQTTDNSSETQNGKRGVKTVHKTRDKCNSCGHTTQWVILSEAFTAFE